MLLKAAINSEIYKLSLYSEYRYFLNIHKITKFAIAVENFLQKKHLRWKSRPVTNGKHTNNILIIRRLLNQKSIGFPWINIYYRCKLRGKDNKNVNSSVLCLRCNNLLQTLITQYIPLQLDVPLSLSIIWLILSRFIF